MKQLFITLALIGTVILGIQIYETIISNYNYEKVYSNLWLLADKSSTIPAKQEYIKQFVTALKDGKAHNQFADYDAMFLQTPNNSFDINVKAVETLSLRLTEIQGMNPSSFEYNTAIQQITAQEQGEAHRMLDVFQNCYNLKNYSMIWGWIGFLFFIFGLFAVIFGWIGIITTISDDRYRW